MINELFSPYGYEVRLFYNKDKKYILETIEYYARKRDSGSLICFMSSHGDQTSLLCPNGEDVQIIDILKRAKTKELESCPKVFFFDACRKYCIYPLNQRKAKQRMIDGLNAFASVY